MTYQLTEKQKRVLYRRGRRVNVPVTRTRAHIEHLHDQGMTYRGIAEAVGLNEKTIGKIVRGEQQLIHVDRERRVLAVSRDAVLARDNGKGFVPKVGAVRRIQALHAIGWTNKELTRRVGINTAVMVNQVGDHITRAKHEKV
ncbi:hypothetical protein, partial [Arthrobacter ginkgonis]|uniref:hypothetical protein n=1 Tax=Arthrobacter ginkgonis TaxID=1630594 RepID=UPI0031ED1AAF